MIYCYVICIYLRILVCNIKLLMKKELLAILEFCCPIFYFLCIALSSIVLLVVLEHFWQQKKPPLNMIAKTVKVT